MSGTLKNRNAVAALVSEAMGAVLQMAHNELLVGPPARPGGGGEDMGAASVSLPVLLGLLENCDGCCGTMLGEVRPKNHYTNWYLFTMYIQCSDSHVGTPTLINEEENMHRRTAPLRSDTVVFSHTECHFKPFI